MPTMNANQSRIKMYRRCQKQYAFRYDYPELLGHPDREMVRKVHKVQIARGTWMHKLQEAHHQAWAGVADDNAWMAAHQKQEKEFWKLFEEERSELGDLPSECLRLFKSYLRFYRLNDPGRYVVAPLDDGTPAVEFLIEIPLPRTEGVKFKGTVDLMVEDLEYGGLWVWDAKWVKSIPAPDERMQSPQACMYVWALRKLGYDVRGFVYNYGRTKPPTTPHMLKKGVLSVAKKMDTDYYTYLTEVKQIHGDRWKEYALTVYKEKLQNLKGRDALWFRRERIPVEDDRIKQALKEFIVSARQIQRRERPLIAPRSYFYNCKFSCEYHGLCCAEFQGLDIEPLVKAQFTFDDERYDEPEDLLKD